MGKSSNVDKGATEIKSTALSARKNKVMTIGGVLVPPRSKLSGFYVKMFS